MSAVPPRGASPGWPTVLEHGDVRLRPLTQQDRHDWRRLRRENAVWLGPWDATPPANSRTVPKTFSAMVRTMRREARAGRQLPFVVEHRGEFVGQLSVNNVVRGSAQFASVGYWIAQSHAGRGITTVALALTVDHCLGPVGLHRVEVAIRPENASSLRVVEKLGFDEVGYARGYLHIDGDWRDHRLFAVTAEDLPPGGMLDRLLDTRRAHGSHPSHESTGDTPRGVGQG